MDNEKYPPLSEFDVIGDIGLRFAVKFECDLEIAPVRAQGELSASMPTRQKRTFQNGHARGRHRPVRSSFWMWVTAR